MSTANTFGTFLETFKRLESTPDQTPQNSSVDLAKSVLDVANILAATGSLPVKVAIAESALPKDVFFTVMNTGVEKNVFSLSEHAGESVLNLTTLGKSLL